MQCDALLLKNVEDVLCIVNVQVAGSFMNSSMPYIHHITLERNLANKIPSIDDDWNQSRAHLVPAPALDSELLQKKRWNSSDCCRCCDDDDSLQLNVARVVVMMWRLLLFSKKPDWIPQQERQILKVPSRS